MAKKIVRLTESDMNKLVKKIIKEDESSESGPVRPYSAKDFISALYDIADKYGKVDIKLTYDGKYISGVENNTRQKFTVTIT